MSDTYPAINTDRAPWTVRLEFQLKEGEDPYSESTWGIREQIEHESGVESCDSGTGFTTEPPTRDFGWPAKGLFAADFLAKTIESVMERRGYPRETFTVTRYSPETDELFTYEARS